MYCFIACVSPFISLEQKGLSTCAGSPIRTILHPSPVLSIIVFSSYGVKFCASSTRISVFLNDLPLTCPEYVISIASVLFGRNASPLILSSFRFSDLGPPKSFSNFGCNKSSSKGNNFDRLDSL